eukprot:TRINITY_DN7339_c0_g1_i1.p1 TRINITY_DN7339_c0_g1~~TRINITY_DN7339_c0_g1_i1.p1  ORF type:complete len:233 (+),score=65.79 TRINITY_DN7339_c0_g1_i1:197-895(+)
MGYLLYHCVFKMCTLCRVPFFAGAYECAPADEAESKDDIKCVGCACPTMMKTCPEHGTDYIQWKCRYCCSLSSYECFGYLHVCDTCHPCPPLNSLMDFSGPRDENGHYRNFKPLHEYHQCPVAPGHVPLKEKTGDLKQKVEAKLAQARTAEEAAAENMVAMASALCNSLQACCKLKTLPALSENCLLYTSDAADEEDSVDLGGRRIIKKKKKRKIRGWRRVKKNKQNNGKRY